MAKQKNPREQVYPTRIAFLTTDEQAARLTAHSVESGMPVATILRRAIDAYLPKTAKPRAVKPAAPAESADPSAPF